MFELGSQRLCLREVAEDDLPDLLPIYLTNTEVMQASNDSQGETMQYDLERLHHDWEQVQSTPGEYMLGIYLKETGEAVGVARYLERNPADGARWGSKFMIQDGIRDRCCVWSASFNLILPCLDHAQA